MPEGRYRYSQEDCAMKKNLIALCAAITIAVLPCVTSAGPAKPAEDPPRIVEIRALYQQIVRDRDLVCMIADRYEHNPRKQVLPGLGPVTYHVTAWRYFEHGWEQMNPGRPMPKSWLAQMVYSDCEECPGGRQMFEFLFDDGGRLVFFYQSAPKSMERRYYFTAEKPVRVVEGKEIVDTITAEHRSVSDGMILRAAYELKRAYMPDIFMK